MRFIVVIILMFLLSTHSAEKDSKESDDEELFRNKFKPPPTFVRVLPDVYQSESEVNDAGGSFNESISIMTWNILAPMWVNVDAMRADGVVDLNLLNENIRLRLIVRQILETNADIVTLQEVQENVYNEISRYISPAYEPVAFAPNKKDYWKSFLPEGEEYVKNGVAIFSKKNKFELISQNSFVTSTIGSEGLTAVLRPLKPRVKSKEKSEPIAVLTFHLETGFTDADSATRMEQGTAVMTEADRITEIVSNKYHERKPVVILTGDINSQSPFPGFSNFKKHGYLDVAEKIGDPARHTFFYPNTVTLPTGPTNGSSIDHVFVRVSDAERIRLLSTEVPDIRSEELTEESYVDRVMKLMMRELRRTKLKECMRMVRCKAFPALFNMTVDDFQFDENVNRVLRLGSDHLPLTIGFELTP